MQGGSNTDTGVLNWISGEINVDPSYLCLHYNIMQANWQQYI